MLDEVNSNLSCGTGSGNAHMADATQEWERTSVFSVEGEGKTTARHLGERHVCVDKRSAGTSESRMTA